MKAIILMFVLLVSTITKVIDTPNRALTHQDLYEKLVQYDIEYPDIVFAQAVIETGNFTSGLFKSQNNLFGMKMPGRRETTAIGKNKNGYAKYINVDDSILDYYLFQQFVMRKKKMTRKEYLAYISRNYAADKNYVNKINKKIKEYKELFI